MNSLITVAGAIMPQSLNLTLICYDFMVAQFLKKKTILLKNNEVN